MAATSAAQAQRPRNANSPRQRMASQYGQIWPVYIIGKVNGLSMIG